MSEIKNVFSFTCSCDEISKVKDSFQLGFYLNRLVDVSDAQNKYSLAIGDILSGDYTHCLLTNYKYDLTWLFRQCPRLKTVDSIFVHGERDPTLLTTQCKDFANISLVLPYLPIPFGTHHTKMMVIFYKHGVRVAIFTANFISSDWETKTQGIWLQDFPLKVGSSCDSSSIDCNFENDLVSYLMKLGPKVSKLAKELRRYDFATANVALVPSVPGYHKKQDIYRYGHLKMKRLLQTFGVKEELKESPLICQFSSLGSIDEKWLYSEFVSSFVASSDKKLQESPDVFSVQNNLHLVWPTVESVRMSSEGWQAGGSLPCTEKNMKKFLHHHLRIWRPPRKLYRTNAMPHIKSYTRYSVKNGDEIELSWVLLTSSNLSKAAWGTLQKKNTQLMIRSYELGVLFTPLFIGEKIKSNPVHKFSCTPTHPVLGDSECNQSTNVDFTKRQTVKLVPIVYSSKNSKAASRDNTYFFPLPYNFPPPAYSPDSDTPWVWDKVYKEKDIYGLTYNPFI